MDLFSITCTTCKTRLKVREQSAIGQILACPKCGGMVMVKPPPNWSSGAAENAELPTATEVVSSAPPINQTVHNSAFEALDELLSDAPPKLRRPAGSAAPGATPVPGSAVSPFSASPNSTAPPSATPSSSSSVANKPRFVEGPRVISTSPRPKPNATPPPTKSELKPDPISGAPTAMASAAAATSSAPAESARDPAPLPPPPPSEPDPAAAPSRAASRLRFWLLTSASVLVGSALAFVAVTAAIRLLRGPSATQPIVKAITSALSPANPTKSTPSPRPSEEAPSVETKDSPPTEASLEPQEPTASAPAPMPPAPPPSLNAAPPTASDPAGIVTTPPTDVAKTPSTNSLAKFDRLLTDEDSLSKQTAVPPAVEVPRAAMDDGAPIRPVAPRPPPRDIDVAKRLSDPLLGIETAGTPLADFLQLISDFSTIPITLEPDALSIVNATTASPVVVSAANSTVKGALAAALHPLKLEAVEQNGQLVVRAAEPAAPATLNFPVKDLAPDEESMTALAEMLKALVEPTSWGEAAEQPAMTVDAKKGTLAIRHSRAVHAQLLLACEKLRTARGLKQQSRIDSSFFTINTRSSRAQARLETPISLTYSQPTRLSAILDRLGELGGVRVLVDWRDVASAGWNPAGEATLVVSQQPLSAALDALLAPLDLTWRIIDGQTLEVVTPARLAEQTEIELYKVGELIGDDPTGEALLGKIRAALGDSTFRLAGGHGEIRYDEAGKCLLASLAQPKQRELEALLAKWRAEANQ